MMILLTGASGFIGRATLAALIERGQNIVAVSRHRPNVPGHYDWLPVDLQEQGCLRELSRAGLVDAVLHLAWNVEHAKFWTSDQNLAWVSATMHLALAARAMGVKRFVGVGTCYEYDWPSDADCDESSTPVAPDGLYATSKDATRRVLQTFCQHNLIEFAWARPFFMFGEGEGENRLVPSICRALAQGEVAHCSSGRVIRDFSHVDDVGGSLASLVCSEASGEVNIGSGYRTTVADLALTLGSIAGRTDLIHLGALPDRAGDPPRITADTRRLRTLTPQVRFRSLAAGLSTTYDYWRDRRDI